MEENKDKEKQKQKYSSFRPDSTGFRLYNAWVGNKTVRQDNLKKLPNRSEDQMENYHHR